MRYPKSIAGTLVTASHKLIDYQIGPITANQGIFPGSLPPLDDCNTATVIGPPLSGCRSPGRSSYCLQGHGTTISGEINLGGDHARQ